MFYSSIEIFGIIWNSMETPRYASWTGYTRVRMHKRYRFSCREGQRWEQIIRSQALNVNTVIIINKLMLLSQWFKKKTWKLTHSHLIHFASNRYSKAKLREKLRKMTLWKREVIYLNEITTTSRVFQLPMVLTISGSMGESSKMLIMAQNDGKLSFYLGSFIFRISLSTDIEIAIVRKYKRLETRFHAIIS